MKAIRIHSFGGPEVLKEEEAPKPEAGAGEIIIRVQAAGVNPVDYKMRSGQYRGGVSLPATLGREVSGVVASVGPGVSQFKLGDAVYAMLGKYSGGYAEFSRAGQNEAAAKPSTLDYIHAAAVPLAATTAWQGLFDHGGLHVGERVLIHGAAGGVGHFAVQLAKARGATVIATARDSDLDFVRSLGADELIDYRNQEFETVAEKVDLVLDLIGGKTQERSIAVLGDGGRLVSTLALDDAARRKAAEAGVGIKQFMAEPKTAQLGEIGRLIDAGEVTVEVDRVHSLDEASEALDELEHEHIRGKIVLAVVAPASGLAPSRRMPAAGRA